jgi:inhibitor of KinA sporulation pathway (predicted exonuclease)
MNYIVLDLEWNQSYRGKEYSIEEMPFEIIQIGAVKLDEHKNITGRWERIIRPVEYVKLHGKVSEMLEITDISGFQGRSRQVSKSVAPGR